MELVLASTSSIRRKVLTDAKVPFRCLIGEGSEPDPEPGESARDYVLRAAEAKATICWESHHKSEDLSQSLILGCDQVVNFRGKILRKVKDSQSAVDRLMAFSEEDHELVNGLVMIENGQVVVRRNEIVTLRCRPLARIQIERYVEREQPYSSVACYFLEGEGIKLIEKFDGDFFAALGLPVRALVGMLSDRGVDLYPEGS
jgi:septum formation protein